MRRIALTGLLVLALVGAGLTIAWVRTPDLLVRATGVAAVAQGTDVDQAISDSGENAVKQAIAAVGPAVVRVDVTGPLGDSMSELLNDPFFRQFFGTPVPDQDEEQVQAVGSGFVISYEGEKVVLTNGHVVEDATSIHVIDGTGKIWDADVVGADDVVDVAVLRLTGDASSLASVTLGDSDGVEVGDWAIAFGNPLGLSYTVTLGIVSATGRDMTKPEGAGTFYNLIQTDAAINPGNSGGPLANSHGEVIGISTMITRSAGNGVTIEGINFAIPINSVKNVLDELMESGDVQRGWLGVGIGDVTAAAAAAMGIDPNLKGAIVTRVFPGDPADLAGVELEDVITRIGDTIVTSAEGVSFAVADLPVGTTVEIEVVRGGESLVLQATLGERPSEEDLVGYAGQTPDAESTASFGITVGPLTEVVARQLGLNSLEGVVIMEIASGSRAELAGLNVGDVILGVDRVAVDSVDAWNTAVASIGVDEQVTLTVFRSGRLAFVQL